MPENLPGSRDFASRLIQQDDPLTPQQYEEYRMRLETALSVAEHREKWTGITAVASFSVSLALMFLGASRRFGAFDPFSKDATPLSILLGIVYATAAVTFWLSLASYFARRRPAVREAKDRLRDADIADIKREIRELRALLAPGSNPTGRTDDSTRA